MKDDVENMKKRIKAILIPFVLLATLLLVTACAGESSHYDQLDEKGNSISVRYDANGGRFDTGAYIIVDSYQADKLPKNSNGDYELALLDPNNSIRGEGNYHMPTNTGYFLAGWYTERTETGKDANGNPIYTYANKWDFDKSTQTLDGSKEYSSNEPVLTLYAAWVPQFEINFYTVDGEKLGDKPYTFNPLEVTEKDMKVPAWNDQGAMEMYKFPKKDGYTFKAAYYDAEMTQPLTDSVVHTAVLNEANGTAQNTSMNIYVEFDEGNWYHVYNVEQFKKYASPKNSLVLHEDLDFGGGSWASSLASGVYVGTIEGNNHTISNVKVVQNDNAKMSVGLFGTLSETAQLKDVHFDNVTFVLQKGPKTTGTTYGLLAGTIKAKATLENVTITASKIQVDAENFMAMTDDYKIGLICGDGYNGQVDYSGISYEVINNDSQFALQKLEIKKVEGEENIIEISSVED